MPETGSLGRSALLVPRLGVGTMTWGRARGRARLNHAKLWYGGSKGPAEEERAFVESMRAGVRLFDTAAAYSDGASEIRLGELSAGTDALIATKFPPNETSAPDDMPSALRASLARLGRSSVDLYQHHFPGSDAEIRRLMAFMADAVDEGLIRAVGVSNYTADQMRLAHAVLADRGIPLASNQVKYNLLHRVPETDGVLDTCRELGVTLIAHQPLANGALAGTYLKRQPRGLRRFKPVFRRSARQSVAAVVAVLESVGARHDATPAQVALRWLIQDETVLPIPGAKSASQAVANAGALTFSLQADELDEINEVTRRWRQAPVR